MFKNILDEHRNGIVILNKKFEVYYSNNVLKKIFKEEVNKRCGEFFECINQNISKKRCLETTKCKICNIRNNIKKVLLGEINAIYIDNIEYEAIINNQREKISMNIEIKKIEKDGESFVLIEFFKLKTKKEILISDKRILDGMLDNLGDYIFYKNRNGEYIYANKAFCEYISIKKIDLIGKKDEELFSKNLAKEWREGDQKALEMGKYIREEKFNSRYFKVTKQRIDLDDEMLLVCVSRDITYEKQEMKKAYLDGLTGVGNRHGYDKKIRKIFKNRFRDYSLALLDLDYLREINNELGHYYGDLALQNISKVIKKIGVKHIYRIGGDEFAFLIENQEQAFNICQTINEEIKKIKLKNRYLSVSIGVVDLKYEDGIINNFNNVDEALYESKKNGRGIVTKKER